MQTTKVVTLRELTSYVSDAAVGPDILVYNGRMVKCRSSRFPLRFESLIAVMCLEGRCSVRVDLQTLHLHPGSLLILRPQNIIGGVEVPDDDCVIYAVVCSRPMVEEFLLRTTEMLPLLLNLGNYPAVDLLPDQQNRISGYMDILLGLVNGGQTNNLAQKAACLLKACLYEMLDNFNVNSRIQPRTRREELTSRFLRLVANNFLLRRDVAFYAEKLGVSSKHLSAVVKAVGGRTAGDWIENYVVLEAKLLLVNTDMSVYEISEKLNFRSQALFGKYFRHVTGMSPSAFRKTFISVTDEEPLQ